VLTGALLCINRKAVVHVFEAPTPILFDYLRMLKAGASTNFLKNARICSLTEEIPREFPVWGFRVLSQPEEEFVVPDNWLECIFQTLQGFLELGREVSGKTDPQQAQKYLETGQLSRTVAAQLPHVERIQGFVKCTDLCSVDQYLEIYDTPIEFTLEGELVWPVEPFLRY